MELTVVKNSENSTRTVWFDKNQIVSPVHSILRREADRKPVTTQHISRSNNMCITATLVGERKLRDLPIEGLIIKPVKAYDPVLKQQVDDTILITSTDDATFMVMVKVFINNPSGYANNELARELILELQPPLLKFILFNNLNQNNPESLPKGYGWDGVSGVTERLRVQKTKQLLIGPGTWDIPRDLILELSEMALFTPTKPLYINFNWDQAQVINRRGRIPITYNPGTSEEVHVFKQLNQHSQYLGKDLAGLEFKGEGVRYVVLRKNIIEKNGKTYGISTTLYKEEPYNV